MIRSPIGLWSFPLLTVGLVLLGRSVPAPAQQPEMYPSAMARSRAGTPLPNVELPASVPAICPKYLRGDTRTARANWTIGRDWLETNNGSKFVRLPNERFCSEGNRFRRLWCSSGKFRGERCGGISVGLL